MWFVNNGGNNDTLGFFNTYGIDITNNNFTTSVTGVGVADQTTNVLASNKTAWENQMEISINTENVMAYNYYDATTNIPSGRDYDMLFTKGLTPDGLRGCRGEKWEHFFYTYASGFSG